MNPINSEDYIYEIVSQNIRKYRKERNMTQAELAEKCDLSHEFIRRIESTKGKKKFTITTVYKISIALNVEIDKFFIIEK
ncbi:dNA-binding helix-turn-helix protein [Clostridium sp. CAG:1219]|nr:dNA-binding helix-turn-helix protein [Clostridium sp. CAG:1219]